MTASGTRPLLVLGSHNEKKRAELAELLAPLGLRIATLGEFPTALEVEERGQSFGENAGLKATVQAKHLGQWVLGEDSGLVVDALDGGPGIYSARYSGPRASDESNNRRLLEELGDTPLKKRGAHYVCHMTVSDPQGNVRAESEGHCHGRITFEPRGSGGFGYDPLFELIEYHRTFGELGGSVKSVLSHRARAMRRLLPQLQGLVAGGGWKE